VRPKQANSRRGKLRQQSLLGWLIAGLGGLIGSLIELATVPRSERRARDPAEIERELHRIDETLHNIDGCILQLQGKLLTLG
jgi:hypothetical protein